MKSLTITKSGDLIKIPYSDSAHTSARILIDGSYAIYDCKTSTDISNLESILQKPILFIAWVDVFGLKEGWWTIVGSIPLEGDLKNFYPRFFNASPNNGIDVGFYEVYKD